MKKFPFFSFYGLKTYKCRLYYQYSGKERRKMQDRKSKIDLTGLEFCPTCGHKLTKKKTKTEKASKASRENGKKGGRPRKEK
ncbi:MAG: hypothetical protein IJS17_07070 [Clostridia bacterium]|nr:hypothetical protein [Clostridia bacterium]